MPSARRRAAHAGAATTEGSRGGGQVLHRRLHRHEARALAGKGTREDSVCRATDRRALASMNTTKTTITGTRGRGGTKPTRQIEDQQRRADGGDHDRSLAIDEAAADAHGEEADDPAGEVEQPRDARAGSPGSAAGRPKGWGSRRSRRRTRTPSPPKHSSTAGSRSEGACGGRRRRGGGGSPGRRRGRGRGDRAGAA